MSKEVSKKSYEDTQKRIAALVEDLKNRVTPADIREIDVFGLANTQFLTYSPSHQLDCCYLSIKGKNYGGAALVYFDGTGVYMTRCWADTTPNKMVVKFFAFGCAHDYIDQTVGKCEHKWTCKKCGHQMLVDTSD